jgi:hypothetical protein
LRGQQESATLAASTVATEEAVRWEGRASHESGEPEAGKQIVYSGAHAAAAPRVVQRALLLAAAHVRQERIQAKGVGLLGVLLKLQGAGEGKASAAVSSKKRHRLRLPRTGASSLAANAC